MPYKPTKSEDSLKGMTIGNYVVIGKAERERNSHNTYWILKCIDCGRLVKKQQCDIVNKKNISCRHNPAVYRSYRPPVIEVEYKRKYGCGDCADLKHCRQTLKKFGVMVCKYQDILDAYDGYENYLEATKGDYTLDDILELKKGVKSK